MKVLDAFGRPMLPPSRKSTIDLTQHRSVLWPTTQSGVAINERTALEVSTVLAIVRRIATDIAKLGCGVVLRTPDGHTIPQPRHRMHRVIARRPNRWQTAFEFKEMMTAHAVLHGDAVAIKQTVGGEVDELVPLVPGQFRVEQLPDWTLVYHVQGPHGTPVATLPASRVFHLKNTTWNGYSGLNLSRAAREAIGLAAALEGSHAQLQKNGAKPLGVLTSDQTLDDEQIDRIVSGWREATTAGRAYSTPLLDGGLKFMPVSLDAEKAQTVPSRKHQIIEICAAFGMLPAVLGVDDKTNAFASVESMFQAYTDQVIWPWSERWRQRLDLDCLDGEGDLEVHFDLSQMRKASAKDQAEADVKLVTNGLRTRNELRARDGLPPIDGGDKPMRPVNMAVEGEDQDEDQTD